MAARGDRAVRHRRRNAADLRGRVGGRSDRAGLLDYSVASLQAVDDIIEGLRRDGCTSSQVGETTFGFGCYVGEVFVRHAGGRWRSGKESAHAVFHDAPLMVELANGKWCNPVGKVFKRLDAGTENSLPYFYRVFADQTDART
ncbi:MAG: hypothetical protein K8T90_09980 [Planctomycetes bacterium]|nr:hypothetical protein [Planctomycetota bacterium]